jgi:hypothetical protein
MKSPQPPPLRRPVASAAGETSKEELLPLEDTGTFGKF